MIFLRLILVLAIATLAAACAQNPIPADVQGKLKFVKVEVRYGPEPKLPLSREIDEKALAALIEKRVQEKLATLGGTVPVKVDLVVTKYAMPSGGGAFVPFATALGGAYPQIYAELQIYRLDDNSKIGAKMSTVGQHASSGAILIGSGNIDGVDAQMQQATAKLAEMIYETYTKQQN